ncbi:MAG: tripartite tricarboxylate transporter substrate binding protein [Burkholderiales bacterium]
MRIARTLILMVALAAPAGAAAQSWPDRPIRFVVSFPPGGVFDTLARLIGPELARPLGQPIVIENRPGAGGNIAADAVVKSAPDGYTFLVGSEALPTSKFIYRALSFDPDQDLAPVTKLAHYPVALAAHPSLPANSVGDLVALARARPGQINFGSAGVGTMGHLAGEYFSSLTGVEMTHVPYKGGAPALQDLVAGRIQVMFISVSLSAPQVRQGRLKVLAVAGKQRAARLPEAPTTAEAGYPDFEALLFASLYAPAKTPAAIVHRMSAELGNILAAPDVQKRMAELGAVPAASTPEEFSRELRAISVRWGRLIRDRNIHLD